MDDLCTLRTSRLGLRHWHEADREPFAAMSRDPRVMEFYPSLITRAECDAFIDRAQQGLQQNGYGLFAVALFDTGNFIGYVGLAKPGFIPGIEIGWRLATEYWGQGLATEASREVIRFAFNKFAIPEVISFTVPANIRSRRVMEKLGMSHDSADDFEHPALPPGHPLGRHVLYRLKRKL